MTTTTARRYFLAVNRYRSSTDGGFANTWRVVECHNARQQRLILREGLPVHDVCGIDSDGRRTTCYSTMGVRAATAMEIRAAKQQEECGCAIELCDVGV